MLIACSLSASTIYLQDTFSDGSRTDQNLPNSADWYAAAQSPGLTVVNGALQLNTASGNSGTLAYFTPTAMTLGIGSSLQVSFNFAISGTLASQDRAFGVFLYNSGGSRLTQDDSSGFNSPLFNAYTGYGITYDPQSANPGRYRTVERNGTANSLFTSTANGPLGNATASSVLTAGQVYSGRLTLTRSATSIAVNGNINGSLISNIDSSSTYTQFDTVAFLALGSDIPVLTLDNISVSGAPEPPMFVLIGIGVLFLLVPGARPSRRLAAR